MIYRSGPPILITDEDIMAFAPDDAPPRWHWPELPATVHAALTSVACIHRASLLKISNALAGDVA